MKFMHKQKRCFNVRIFFVALICWDLLNFFLKYFRILAKKLPKDVDKNATFACNELDLEEIQVYGFDYDYTLACYKKSLHYLLYRLARDMLVEKYKVRRLILDNLHIRFSK